MHQVIVEWVLILAAPLLTASVCNVLHLFGWQGYQRGYAWVLNGTPFFPAHIALGLLFGWLLCEHLTDRSMVWVWLFPTALLSYALAAIPTLVPAIVAPEFQAGAGQSRWLHYFGFGCQLGNYCIDQTSFTRPFYASIAYSFGASLSLKTRRRSVTAKRIVAWTTLCLAIWLTVAAVFDLWISARAGQWHWTYLTFDGVPAAMGVILVLLVLSKEPKSVTERS